jgi:hypothetical protein
MKKKAVMDDNFVRVNNDFTVICQTFRKILGYQRRSDDEYCRYLNGETVLQEV